MSNEEKRNPAGKNVDKIWGVESASATSSSRFGHWDAKKTKPAPEPVAEEPAPEPAPKPAPVQKGEDGNAGRDHWSGWVSGTTLNNMADHLRRAKRLKITIEQAKELVLNDEETKVIYQNHQKQGKF